MDDNAVTAEALSTLTAAISNMKSVIDSLVPRIVALEIAIYQEPRPYLPLTDGRFEWIDSRTNHSFTIFVKPVLGGYRALSASSSDRIADVKSPIDWYPGHHLLVFHGEQVDDDKTIRDYGIRPGDVLYQVRRPRLQLPVSEGNTKINVFFKKPEGSYIRLEVDRRESIWDVKLMLYDEIGVFPEQQRFIFAGKQLEDDTTVGSHSLQEDSTIAVILSLKG
jgi:hypothetical protein